MDKFLKFLQFGFVVVYYFFVLFLTCLTLFRKTYGFQETLIIFFNRGLSNLQKSFLNSFIFFVKSDRYLIQL